MGQLNKNSWNNHINAYNIEQPFLPKEKTKKILLFPCLANWTMEYLSLFAKGKNKENTLIPMSSKLNGTFGIEWTYKSKLISDFSFDTFFISLSSGRTEELIEGPILKNYWNLIGESKFCRRVFIMGFSQRSSNSIRNIRCIIISSEITITKLSHSRNNSIVFIQTRVNLWCHNLQKWESLTNSMDSFRRLSEEQNR